MKALLERLVEKNKVYIDKGNVADYIPALSKMDKDLIGISIIDEERRIHSVGDCDRKFTIQSISKVIGLMVAILERGESYVFDRVGYYGTDDKFNSYYKLESNKKPLNPYMNAGAILVTSMIEGEEFIPYEKILDMLKYITKNDCLDYNREVYLSEKETGHRNRGIFYILKNNGLIDKEEISLDNYFRQCCIEVDTVDLAKIGYFFANDCIRYDGDRRYENKDMARIINSTMMNCGMYDYSGEYSRTVGIPSKSGVGGGIMGSVPRKIGIGVFSPPLDDYGNSIVGYNILKDLSERLDLSIF